MLKKNWFVAVVIILCVAILNVVGITVYQQVSVKPTEKLNYVALGDSITYGYNLPEGEKNYATLISENFNTNLTNYSVVGMTSEEMLNHLTNGEYDLESADIITVGIGSNDLLRPFQKVITETLGIDTHSSITQELIKRYVKAPLSILTDFSDLGKALESSSVFLDAVNKYRYEFFPATISEIRKINPTAEVIVLNLFNPYYEVELPGLNLGKLCNEYIISMNEAFNNPLDYKVVDVYKYFNAHGMTNVNVSLTELTKLNFDPHPSTQGQMVIYTLINEILENQKYNKNYQVS